MVQLVSNTGTVTKTYNYDAFGVEYDIDENDTNYFRYTGQYFDTESGTYYLRARYYNPANGRFTQQDGWEFINSSDTLSLNLYIYCSNNPIRYNDLSGTTAMDVVAGIFLALIENLNGLNKKIIEFISKGIVQDLEYTYESEYDYYLGRVIGDIIAYVIGMGVAIKGVLVAISAIGAGAAVTWGTGGLLLVGGVQVSVAGVALGAAMVVEGAAAAGIALASFNNDFGKMQTALTTQKEATEAAEILGYKKTNYYSKGKPVYERVSGNGPKYITPDRTSHNGGVWKGADSIDDLTNRTTRTGTYNGNLEKIGK